MTTPSTPHSRKLFHIGWRIVIAMLPLGAGLSLALFLLPVTGEVSATLTMAIRIATGLEISALVIGVIAMLVRFSDQGRLRDAVLTSLRTGWRLAVWGRHRMDRPCRALVRLDCPPRFPDSCHGSDARTGFDLAASPRRSSSCRSNSGRDCLPRIHHEIARRCHSRVGIITCQAVLFTLFAALLRQNANLMDISLFLAMGIGFGYLRMITGSVWMPIGFHTAFQTGAQLDLTQDALDFAGGNGPAMLALGAVPFAAAAIMISSTGIPRAIYPGPRQRPA